MERLTVAITHVPETRARMLQMVRAGLGGLPHVVINDTERNGIWATVRRAWLTALDLSGGEGHVAVFADDMVPVPGFRAAISAALDAQPKETVCVFSARPTAVRAAKEAGVHWATSVDGAWGGAVIMPAASVSEFVEWADANVPLAFPHDDRRITLWNLATGRTVWLTLPTLVDHAAPNESLVGHGGGPYRASFWLADDATGIDWTRGIERPVRLPTRLSKDVIAMREGEWTPSLSR